MGAAAPVIVSLFALMLSVVAMLRQHRAAKAGHSISVLISLISEYRSPEMRQSRQWVLRQLDTDYQQGERSFSALPDEGRVHALRLSHFYDHLGLLAAHRLIDPDAALGYLGDSMMDAWTRLEPFIFHERTSRINGEYQEYFDMFVRYAKLKSPTMVRREIRARFLRSRLAIFRRPSQ